MAEFAPSFGGVVCDSSISKSHGNDFSNLSDIRPPWFFSFEKKKALFVPAPWEAKRPGIQQTAKIDEMLWKGVIDPGRLHPKRSSRKLPLLSSGESGSGGKEGGGGLCNQRCYASRSEAQKERSQTTDR